MEKPAYHLVINPVKEQHYPERYKAVLLYKGGLSSMFSHGMTYDAIMQSVASTVRHQGGILEITYNEKTGDQ